MQNGLMIWPANNSDLDPIEEKAQSTREKFINCHSESILIKNMALN